MNRAHRTAIVALALAGALASPASVAGPPLNDTGVTSCYDGVGAQTGVVSGETPLPESAGFEGQDCTRGRTAADALGVLSKTGAGAHGFDFTKIANDGSDLPASAALGANPGDWACTRDNHTGLTWEVKKPASPIVLGSTDHTYSWYDGDAASNGGNPGAASNGSCASTLPNCNTSEFAAAMNTAARCGYTNWRMPSVQELQSLVRYQGPLDGSSNSIDHNYFPNMSPTGSPNWSGTNFAPNATKAWHVLFYSIGTQGRVATDAKINAFPVILVRSAP